MDYTMGDFCSFLETYRDFLGDLLMLSQEKLRLVLDDNVAELEKLLKREQAMIMRIDSFEKKRMDFQKHMNMDGMRLSQIIISLADGAEQKLLSLLYDEINFYISDIRELGSHVANITGDRIAHIRGILSSRATDNSEIYDGSGHRSAIERKGEVIGKSV